MPKLSRRAILGTGVAALASTSFGVLTRPGQQSKRRSSERPKNIIFCVADGMAMQTVSMCDVYQQVVFGQKSYWNWLMNQEFTTNGLQMTRSLSSVVTDSSAASTAWGSGRHIWNGQVNMFPDGTKLTTIFEIFQSHGMKTGLVTTATATHATPSGCVIKTLDRDDEEDIAHQHLTANVDVLMGGGNKFFSAKHRKDKRDLYGEFAAKGYTVAKTRDELLAVDKGRVLGIFSDSHVPYSVDRNNSAELKAKVPTLAEMASVALKHLHNSPKGFMLQIEGGRVDHGGHANDLAALFYDQIAFEEAVKVAVDYATAHGDTLVVVTTDHATGGPSLNGDGPEYFDTTAGLESFGGLKSSYAAVIKDFGSPSTVQSVKDSVKHHLSIELTTEEAQAVVDASSKTPQLAVLHFESNVGGTLAMVLGNHTKVTWTSQNHTAEHVIVSAVGPGSHWFAGLRENITFFDHLLALKGLKHSNPTMTLAEAKPIYDKAHQKSALDEDLTAYTYGTHA